MSEPYVSRKVVNQSYRPRSGLMSPGLLRARAPFRLRNAITGLILASFGVGVWAYSISAVKQDDFSDVDEEAKELIKGRAAASPGTGAGGVPPSASKDAVVDAAAAVVPVVVSAAASNEGRTSPSVAPPRGVLAPILDRTFPRLLDPTRKTLVWGAPPLDNIGRVNLKSSSQERR
ncbi:hypothetical protein BU15DRAFT_47345 [Melanogaster broomeanus]|nr:hypothetical protein BU15DRAFT_47345 [Melanogaster broomeanus]